MPAISSERDRVFLSGGLVVDRAVLYAVLDLEQLGARFTVQPDGRIRVDPPGLLDATTREFLRASRDQVRAIVTYRADDSHLWSDGRKGAA